VAGLIATGIAASLLSIFAPESAPPPAMKVAEVTQAPTRPVRVAPVKPAKKTVSTKTNKQKPVKVEPYVVPSNDLMLSFPEPTPITIKVANKPSYVKLSHLQQELDASASSWNCVVDRNTSLTWEKKTSDRGMRDAENFYSWYNPNTISNGGNAGAADSGKCRGGIDCDTNAYVKAVNEMKLCGYSDWRLPTRAELMSLVQYSGKKTGKGLIDSRYFPGASSDWYWASDSDASNPRYAWYVLYFNGRYMRASKSEAKRVRLVRSNNERSMRNMAQVTTAVAEKADKRAENSPTSKKNSSGS
jgi:hypothetical protein